MKEMSSRIASSRLFQAAACLLGAGWIMVLYGLFGPRYDYYTLFRILGLVWLGLGFVPLFKGKTELFYRFPFSFLVALWLHFPLLFIWFWPLKTENKGLFAAFYLIVAALECLWLHERGVKCLKKAACLFWLLFPWLLLGGYYWAVMDIDYGPLGAPFGLQLIWMAAGIRSAAWGISHRNRKIFMAGLGTFFAAFAVTLLAYLWVWPDPVYLPIVVFFLIVCYKVFPLLSN
ncbi:MAG: hypothetical protein LKE33_12440 [Acidaminococcus sp.]|jgi:hypothetical protein|nr:hypothetical protein [Acidaminococcus sp.]MCI2099527.1 hypothetical protein [Acidaminococcus sp.]MCI2113612.1 hypothetical protein [Acidaminococcus sp.]MCI2115695.1 hypothetical protein [Acidaminococcus sp.]